MPQHYHLPHDLLSTPPTSEVYLLAHAAPGGTARNLITLHYHLFSFPLAGEKRVVQPLSTVTADSSRFLLLASGHCLMSEKHPDPGAAFRSTMLFFRPEALAAFFRKYPALTTPGAAGAAAPVVAFSVDDFLRNFVHSLNLLLESGAEPLPGLAQLKLEELLLYLVRRYPACLPALRALAAETTESLEIRQVVEAHADQPVTVDELAFLCHMSVSTFKRRFARLYGTTPNKWLVQRRLAVAAGLLEQGALKASEVYYRVGYQNMSSFIQSFQQAYGVTPKNFQRQKLNV
jgi:AraC-like DNA-binding protein